MARGLEHLERAERIAFAQLDVEVEPLDLGLPEGAVARRSALEAPAERRPRAFSQIGRAARVIEVVVGERDARDAVPLLRRRPDPLEVAGVRRSRVDHPGGLADEIGIGPRQRHRPRIRGPYPFDPLGKRVLVQAHQSQPAQYRGERPSRRELGRADRVRDGVWRLRLPLPWPGVPHVNSFAVDAGDGIVLFDTGYPRAGRAGGARPSTRSGRPPAR